MITKINQFTKNINEVKFWNEGHLNLAQLNEIFAEFYDNISEISEYTDPETTKYMKLAIGMLDKAWQNETEAQGGDWSKYPCVMDGEMMESGGRGHYRYELHFSDGIRQMLKGNDPKKLIAEIEAKPSVREWSLFRNDGGFHSSTQDEYLVKWWDNGSNYWSNRAKKEPKLLDKKYDSKRTA